MNLAESIRIAFENIKANKMRSVLTMLGIIIGISSVITITTIGSSLESTISSSLRSMGAANNIDVNVSAVFPENEEEWDTWVYPEETEDDLISFEDIVTTFEAFSDQIEAIDLNLYCGSGKYSNADNKINVEVQGITGGLETEKIKVIEGRDINLRDCVEKKSTAVVSDWFVKYGCDGKSPIGKKIDLVMQDDSVISVYVVGVYEYSQVLFGTLNEKKPEKDISTPLYISYTAASEMTDGMGGLSYFSFRIKDNVDPEEFSSEIETYYNDTKYKNNEKFEVHAYSMASELEDISQILDVITIAISIIAAISLVVGGIGVMNIMLVSVVERTKEIGIRKALGAKPSTIRKQFLIEAVVICLIGGFIGIVIGLITGFLLTVIAGYFISASYPDMANFMEVSFSPSYVAVMISVVFSTIIGVVFGLYPAKRAAALNPIDALRYE